MLCSSVSDEQMGAATPVVHGHLPCMTTTPTHSGLDRLLTVHELSDYLGIRVATL